MSTDPEFTAKAVDIAGLYLNPPEKALVISVDEKPSIQALEQSTGYVETDNGKRFKSTYKRRGTLNLFAALEVATSAIYTETAKFKRRVEFPEFMDNLMAELPEGRGVHVILDKLLHSQKKRCLAGYTAQSLFSFHSYVCLGSVKSFV